MEEQIQVTSAASESNNGALSTHSLPSSSEIQPDDPTQKINSTETTPIAAQLSATALFEILSSIVTNIQTPNSESNEEGSGPSLTQTPIQLQLQLNSQQSVVVVEEDSEETSTGEAKNSRRRNGSGNNENSQGKGKQSWHYHLGGVRQRRIPLSPEIKEALEVAYVSRIMSKNYRKEGQPEKERISRITGLEMDKVHEWFKNRRKKDKLLQSRSKNVNFPRSKRGRKPIIPDIIPTTTTTTTTITSSTQDMQHEHVTTDHQQTTEQ